jgi:hypothetical protein
MSPRNIQHFRFGFRFLVVAAVLVGGSVGVSMLAEAKRGGGGRRAAPADNRDCKTDKDCVMVADDCCPCSQGGKARAIPKKQQDTYEKDRKKRCADTACTEMMSTDTSCSQVPFCGAGICELGEPPGATPPADDKAKAEDKAKADDKPAKAEDKAKADDKPAKTEAKPKSEKTKPAEKPKADDKIEF